MKRTSTSSLIAGVIVMVQAALGMLAGLAVVRFDLHRRFFHPARVHATAGLGVFLLLVSLAALITGFFVANVQGWARITPLAFEALLVCLVLLTFPFHPFMKLLDLVAAVAVIALLLSDKMWESNPPEDR